MKKWTLCVVVVWALLLVTTCGDDGDNTTTPDNNPPSPVVSKHPPGNATDVARDVVVSATFREDMDSLTVNPSTFTLSYNPAVSGTVAYDKSTRTATFTPDSMLAYGTTYTARLTTGISNSSGEPLDSDYSWSFTIAIDPNLSPVFLPQTGQSSRYAPGDDGYVRSGVA